MVHLSTPQASSGVLQVLHQTARSGYRLCCFTALQVHQLLPSIFGTPGLSIGQMQMKWWTLTSSADSYALGLMDLPQTDSAPEE